MAIKLKIDRLCYENPDKKPRKIISVDIYVIEKTKLSEAIDKWPANTFWLDLSGFECIFIGESIYSLITNASGQFMRYNSNIGNSQVAYLVAYGEETQRIFNPSKTFTLLYNIKDEDIQKRLVERDKSFILFEYL